MSIRRSVLAVRPAAFRFTRRLSIAAAFSLLAGCGDSAAVGAGGDTVLEPVMEDVFRAGTVAGGGWEAFAEIRSLAFDPAGRTYILDSGQHHVVVLDSDGTFIRTIGTRGEGPEEFRQPRSMTVLGSGEVAVYDMGHRSFLVFSPDGEFRRSIRAGIEEGVPGPRIWPHGETGVISVSQGIVMMTGGGGPPSRPTTAPIRRFELGAAGESEVLHEAWLPPRETEGASVQVRGGNVSIAGMGIRAFEPQVHLAALPDGRFVVADSSAYRIRVFSPDGDQAGLAERDVPPRPVGEAEQRLERERRLAAIDEGGGPQISISLAGGNAPAVDQEALRSMIRSQTEEMAFWHEIPVITRISSDPAGRLWVARSGGVSERGPIDLLSAEGEYLGSLAAEAGPIPDAFGPDGLAAWIETDDLDVPYVRVRRIQGIPQP